MSAAATTTVSSGGSSRPTWILLNRYAKIGENTNETTTHCQVTDDMKICASLVRERPPLPSNLYVHCSGAALAERPSSLAMVDDLILFHVYVGSAYRVRSALPSYFFMYRADPNRPSLELLPHPPPQDRVRMYHAFGIFPRGGEEDHYTIASMIPQDRKDGIFTLRLYDSETKTWSSKKLSVESPQDDFPVPIPVYYRFLLSHNMSTVLTLGGTIGWVDLWRGVLFCDMLSGHHTLRGVPLPLPLKLTKPDGDPSDEELTSGRTSRGIAFVGGHLRLVEVRFKAAPVVFVYDQETGSPRWRIENWTITTWTNKEMSNSYDDWRMDGTFQASDIFLGDHLESELPPIDLQNLYVSDPVIGMNGNDMHVVYLTARENWRHPKSWVLAIDTRDRKVQSVVATPGPLSEEMRYYDANYCTCTIISK